MLIIERFESRIGLLVLDDASPNAAAVSPNSLPVDSNWFNSRGVGIICFGVFMVALLCFPMFYSV